MLKNNFYLAVGWRATTAFYLLQKTCYRRFFVVSYERQINNKQIEFDFGGAERV